MNIKFKVKLIFKQISFQLNDHHVDSNKIEQIKKNLNFDDESRVETLDDAKESSKENVKAAGSDRHEMEQPRAEVEASAVVDGELVGQGKL
jgi:hypothetical protein